MIHPVVEMIPNEMKHSLRPITFESNPPNGLHAMAENMYIAAEGKNVNCQNN